MASKKCFITVLSFLLLFLATTTQSTRFLLPEDHKRYDGAPGYVGNCRVNKDCIKICAAYGHYKNVTCVFPPQAVDALGICYCFNATQGHN